MENIYLELLFFIDIAILLSATILHLTDKNRTSIYLYMIQSIAISCLLLFSLLENYSTLLFLAFIFTFILKVFIAPYFFLTIITKTGLKFSDGVYFSTPIMLIIFSLFFIFSHSWFLEPLSLLSVYGKEYLSITIASLFISLFLVINRKGVLSQALGILSLENSIVAFSFFSGLEQGAGLQIGITFNIFIWVIVASIFTGIIYRQFGTLDAGKMRELTE